MYAAVSVQCALLLKTVRIWIIRDCLKKYIHRCCRLPARARWPIIFRRWQRWRPDILECA